MMSNKMDYAWPGWETVRVIGRGSFGRPCAGSAGFVSPKCKNVRTYSP